MKTRIDSATAAKRLQTAFELFEFGVGMQKMKLRREYPDATESELRGLYLEWLRTRPGAEHGDGVGRVVERLQHEPR